MRKHNCWKSLKYAIGGFCIVGMLVGGYFSRNMIQQIIKGDVEKYESSSIDYKASDYAEEDYIVLEIVPDYSYARLGYGFIGCEPLNYFKACNENKNAATWIKEAAGSVDGKGLVEVRKSLTSSEYKKIREYYSNNLGLDIGDYFKKGVAVSSGAGISKTDYVLKSENKFVISNNSFDGYFGESGDDIVVATFTAKDLNGLSKTNLDDLLSKVDMIYVNDAYNSKEEQVKIAKLDEFKLGESTSAGKTYASDATLDLEFSTTVKMMKRIGDREEPLPIIFDKKVYDDALENSAVSKDGITTRQYALNRAAKYSGDGTFKMISSSSDSLFKTKDSDGKALYEAGSNLTGSCNNMYKLYLMSMFRDPAEFYNLFLECLEYDTDAVIDETTGKNNLQTGDAVLYWTPYSFLPCQGEISADFKADPRKKGDEKYWKNMGIALEPESGTWRSHNTLSIEDSLHSKTSLIAAERTGDYEIVSAYTDSRTYTVLELEATNHYNYASDKICKDGKAEGRAYFEKYIPYTAYTNKDTFWVVVKGMSTATFVTKRNDLTSDYDMIYIGSNIDGFRTKDGKTYYGSKKNSDRNYEMNGVIYSHQGPFVIQRTVTGGEKRSWTGKIGEASNYAYFGDGNIKQISCDVGAVKLTKDNFTKGSLRYPGTDITTVRAKHLNSFLNAGLPIVVENELYLDVIGTQKHRFTDDTLTNIEYNTTFFEDIEENEMYQLIYKRYNDVFNTTFDWHDARYAHANDLNKEKVYAIKTICVKRPVLKVEKVTTSAGQVYDSEALKSNCTYDFKSDNSVRQFTFKINVSGTDETSRYMCQIFVDKNADGIYKPNEVVRSTAITLKNSRANVSFNMNTAYTGAFTWKVVVTNNINQDLIASQIGYGNIKRQEDEEKKKIKVLQIKSSNYHSVDWSQKKGDTINLGGKNVADPKNSPKFDSTYSDTSTQLVNMINETSDYNIDVDWMQFLDFGENITSVDQLEKYDMLLFGFADSYCPYKMTETTAKVIQDYIDLGKSVLFTHDLTGPQNHTNWKEGMSGTWETYHTEPNTGKGFNFYLRDVMGLNRFQMNTKIKDTFCSSNYTKHNYHYSSDWLPFGFTYTILMHNSNSYYAGWSGQDRSEANNYAEEKEYWGPYKGLVTNLWVGSSSGNDHHSPTIENGYVAETVAKVNDGQITKYPYDLDKEIAKKASTTALGIDKYSVADTHTQAYQLNVEDADTICWFTMQDAEGSSSKWYDTSPMDGANNYYIYNRGNVTYTGIGHYKEEGKTSADCLTTFEKKLFVNVFVSALRAGIEGPQPEITNGFSVTEKQEDGTETDVQYIYADVDADAKDSEFNESEDVDFYVTDDSTSSSYVYVTVEKQEKDDDGKIVYEPITSKDGISVVNKSGGDVSGPFVMKKDDTEFYVWKIKKSNYGSKNSIAECILKYPRKELENSSSTTFRLVAFGDKGDKGLGIKGILLAKLCRRSLFRLD